ncbi:MAG TPA: LysR family transcriptional regulator [Solirubrobacterales bacterium]|nr:LysR family transcriptional regulator [Solirubrobacterales bacterium]
MRLEQLEYLLTVARSGSFKRAAELLHLSQPALSENVRRLEVELGVELLDRGPDGTKISPEGRELMPMMTEILDAASRLKQGAASADQSHRMTRATYRRAGRTAESGRAHEAFTRSG